MQVSTRKESIVFLARSTRRYVSSSLWRNKHGSGKPNGIVYSVKYCRDGIRTNSADNNGVQEGWVV